MIDLLAKQHADWLRIAERFTGDKDKASDLVQEMYLTVIEKKRNIGDVRYKDKINRYFIWKLLRSIHIDNYRKANTKKAIKTLSFIDGLDDREDYDYNYEGDYMFEEVLSGVIKNVTTWTPYNQQLFHRYFIQEQTLREIAKKSTLSLSSIHTSIKGLKSLLNKELEPELRAYFNNHYNKTNI